MTAIAICSDFGAQKNKVSHCFHCFPICHEVMGPDAMVIVVGMLNFMPAFHSPFSLSSKGSLVLLQFLLYGWCHWHIWGYWYFSWQSWFQLVLHPALHSTYKLDKQGGNMQPWHPPFPIWSQSIFPCPVLTVASWPVYRFLRRQVRWSGIPISLRIFHSLLWSTQSKQT